MDLLTMRKSGRLHWAEEPEEDIMSADLYKRRRAFAGAAFSHAFILSTATPHGYTSPDSQFEPSTDESQRSSG